MLPRLATAIVAIVLVCTGVACGDSSASNADGKVRVVAAFYPLAEAARQVGGVDVHVSNLTPIGAEPHDLELTPKSVDQILDADVVVEMGHGFQPAVEHAAEQRSGTTVVMLDELPIGAGDQQVEDGSKHGLDPHVWLDPTLMARIVDTVRAALAKADPAHADDYATRARTYTTELARLDDEYRAGLRDCRVRDFVTSHEAFAYLAKRYGLQQRGVAGVSPEQEPSPDRIADLADLARREHVRVIFTEDFVSARIADTVAREAGGVRTEVLSPLEGLTEDQQHAGDDYLSVMESNLRKLQSALDCSRP
jgi:zinc transport system substrate-binding protein